MIYRIVALICLIVMPLGAQEVPSADSIDVLIRCDDIGMCHAVNMACEELIASGISFSTSVMFACPWYQEAVELLKQHPEISVGVHLTLNAEWQHYRWGPVVGAAATPSLVDSCGLFFPSRALFFANDPSLEDIEKELRAQIDRALASGLDIDYLDHHMSTAVSTPETRALLESLAKEYGIGISRYFGETYSNAIYSVSPEAKTDSLVAFTKRLEPGTVNLMVFHIGKTIPEMNALQDLNTFGLDSMSVHRQAELDALCSPAFRRTLEEKRVRLVTYEEIIPTIGVDNMRRPAE